MGYSKGKQPVLRKGFNPAVSVPITEGYSLYHYMVTGKPIQQKYLDQRNQWIHGAIDNMIKNAWERSTDNLIYALAEFPDRHELENAGGEAYIRKLIGNFDHARDVEQLGPGVGLNG
jgi:hypothetical protein